MKGPPRKLADFGALTPAEAKLVAECGTEKVVFIGDGNRPDATAGPDRQIRATLIRALLLGDCKGVEVPLHERGVQIAGARITGVLDLLGCESARDLLLVACHFDHRPVLIGASLAAVIFSGSALPGLEADGLVTKGGVFLRETKIDGSVRLLGAQIAGGFFLRDGTTVNGVLDMTAAQIGTLDDDPACWPKQGNLLLDRCIYDAFTGKGINARDRIDWLSRQDPSKFDQDFQPQPWEQCAKVLREMGHRNDARLILIDKEQRQRAWDRKTLRGQIATLGQDRRRRIFSTVALRLRLEAQRNWDAILGAFIGYGYAPQRAIGWLVGVWLLGVYIFATAYAQGAMKPNSPVILRAPEWAYCAPSYVPLTAEAQHQPRAQAAQGQLACFLQQPEAQSYPRFNAWTYSLDTLLPIVSLEMQQYWIPDETAAHQSGPLARLFLWLHIALGWALSLLAVAGFSGLVRND